MRNPAKSKLILSGLIDLIIAMFFGMLIAFTLFYLICPIFNLSTRFSAGYSADYDVMIAKFFGGMSVLVATLFLAIGFTFLIGLIFSFSYVKSCFAIARMELQDANEKTKILTVHGITQLLIGIIALAITAYTAIMLRTVDSSKIVAALDACVGVAFSATAIIKLFSAKEIRRDAAIQRRAASQPRPYVNYYYY